MQNQVIYWPVDKIVVIRVSEELKPVFSPEAIILYLPLQSSSEFVGNNCHKQWLTTDIIGFLWYLKMLLTFVDEPCIQDSC